jgi:microcystin-dependent protein
MDPYLAQIFMFGGGYAPRNYSYCDGSILPISEFQGLFSLLGTTYGGDGRTSFGLPNLKGRMPISSGNGPGLPSYPRGQMEGSFRTQLSTDNMPSHSHEATLTLSETIGGSTIPIANGTIGASNPSGTSNAKIYSPQPSQPDKIPQSPAMTPMTSSGVGGTFTHYPPLISIPYIICTAGLYPSQN